MAKVTDSKKFIEIVRKSELAQPDLLKKSLARILDKFDGEFPEPSELAKEFQKDKVVTAWHCEKLLNGKYKGFFLGKHKLLGHIGSGGMSSVYLAEHLKMGDLRAIKVLPQSKLGKSSYLARFQQEAKAIAALNHPNVVRAHDIDNQGDTHYIVMEYVDGDDLQTIVKKKGPLPFDNIANYMAQAARGLQHAHEVGLIHRDVKPANVLINSKGKVKLLDLGLALFAEDEEASLTMDFNDKVLGTADYLAPEQALNSHKVDHRADLYGLGCTMYFLLVGHPPFPDGTIAQRIARHQKEMPKEVRKLRKDCPGELEGICWKLLQKDPKFRYADATATAEVLETWLVKYQAEKLVPAGGGSSVRLGDEKLTSGSSGSSFSNSKSGSGAMLDTVSNRGEDTMAGRSSSSVTNLSASDSGVLVRVQRAGKPGESDAGSTVNLESEIARRSQSRTGVSGLGSNAQSSVHGQPLPQAASSGVKPIWIVGLCIMFLLAVLLGVFIAKVTTPAVPSNDLQSAPAETEDFAAPSDLDA
ncbi:MAG: serine/threonine protein kinase [Pirellulaceae bacterium]